MQPKKSDSPVSLPNDIDSLFSRAGIAGAKYSVFPRTEQGSNAKASAPPAGTIETAPECVAAIIGHPSGGPIPVLSSRAASVPAIPIALPAWKSIDRIFAESATEPETGGHAQSGTRVALLSLAGGAGKTTLAASLARVLSTRQRRVMVADCGMFPTIDQHLGSLGYRLGPLHLYYPPAGSTGLPVSVLRISLEELQRPDFQSILEQVDTSDGILLMDLPTLQASGIMKALACVDHVLVLLTPSAHSVASLAPWKQLLTSAAAAGHFPKVHYLMNRFDASRTLHRQIKERLQAVLGESLLPFAVPEDRAFEEASASGATISEYRPDCHATDEIAALAEWLQAVCGEERIAQKELMA